MDMFGACALPRGASIFKQLSFTRLLFVHAQNRTKIGVWTVLMMKLSLHHEDMDLSATVTAIFLLHNSSVNEVYVYILTKQ